MTTLHADVSGTDWIFLPELQGRRTDLRLGLSFRDGSPTAVAQWSTADPEEGTIPRMHLGGGTDSAARILTIARLAIVKGFA